MINALKYTKNLASKSQVGSSLRSLTTICETCFLTSAKSKYIQGGKAFTSGELFSESANLKSGISADVNHLRNDMKLDFSWLKANLEDVRCGIRTMQERQYELKNEVTEVQRKILGVQNHATKNTCIILGTMVGVVLLSEVVDGGRVNK